MKDNLLQKIASKLLKLNDEMTAVLPADRMYDDPFEYFSSMFDAVLEQFDLLINEFEYRKKARTTEIAKLECEIVGYINDMGLSNLKSFELESLRREGIKLLSQLETDNDVKECIDHFYDLKRSRSLPNICLYKNIGISRSMSETSTHLRLTNEYMQKTFKPNLVIFDKIPRFRTGCSTLDDFYLPIGGDSLYLQLTKDVQDYFYVPVENNSAYFGNTKGEKEDFSTSIKIKNLHNKWQYFRENQDCFYAPWLAASLKHPEKLIFNGKYAYDNDAKSFKNYFKSLFDHQTIYQEKHSDFFEQNPQQSAIQRSCETGKKKLCIKNTEHVDEVLVTEVSPFISYLKSKKIGFKNLNMYMQWLISYRRLVFSLYGLLRSRFYEQKLHLEALKKWFGPEIFYGGFLTESPDVKFFDVKTNTSSSNKTHCLSDFSEKNVQFSDQNHIKTDFNYFCSQILQKTEQNLNSPIQDVRYREDLRLKKTVDSNIPHFSILNERKLRDVFDSSDFNSLKLNVYGTDEADYTNYWNRKLYINDNFKINMKEIDYIYSLSEPLCHENLSNSYKATNDSNLVQSSIYSRKNSKSTPEFHRPDDIHLKREPNKRCRIDTSSFRSNNLINYKHKNKLHNVFWNNIGSENIQQKNLNQPQHLISDINTINNQFSKKLIAKDISKVRKISSPHNNQPKSCLVMESILVNFQMKNSDISVNTSKENRNCSLDTESKKFDSFLDSHMKGEHSPIYDSINVSVNNLDILETPIIKAANSSDIGSMNVLNKNSVASESSINVNRNFSLNHEAENHYNFLIPFVSFEPQKCSDISKIFDAKGKKFDAYFWRNHNDSGVYYSTYTQAMKSIEMDRNSIQQFLEAENLEINLQNFLKFKKILTVFRNLKKKFTRRKLDIISKIKNMSDMMHVEIKNFENFSLFDTFRLYFILDNETKSRKKIISSLLNEINTIKTSLSEFYQCKEELLEKTISLNNIHFLQNYKHNLIEMEKRYLSEIFLRKFEELKQLSEIFDFKIPQMKVSKQNLLYITQAIKDLNSKKEAYQKIVDLIKEHDLMKEEMIKFEKTASDPKRLFRSSFQLIKEEKFRKNAVPHLLKLENDIFEQIEKYHENFGVFMFKGLDYKQILENEIKNRIINKTVYIIRPNTNQKAKKGP